jgi:hypothetical protein
MLLAIKRGAEEYRRTYVAHHATTVVQRTASFVIVGRLDALLRLLED